MKIDRKKLLDSIVKVKPGLANKEIVEQSTSFVFKDGKVITYNDRIMISHSVDIKFTGVIPAQEFYDLLNKSKDEYLNISNEKDKVFILGKRFKATIVLESKIQLPIDIVEISSKWKKISDDFLEVIKFCNFAVADNMSNPVITNLYINKNIIYGTDAFRLIGYKIENINMKKILIPKLSIKELVNYKIVKYQLSNNCSWIHFKTKDGVIFSSRLGKGEYPDIKSIFSGFKKGAVINFPDIILDVIDRASVLADIDPTNSSVINIEVNKGKMLIKSNGPNGNFQESCDTDKHIKDFSFNIDPEFLKEILKYETVIHLSKDGNKLRFHDDNFDYIIAVNN